MTGVSKSKAAKTTFYHKEETAAGIVQSPAPLYHPPFL